MVYNIHTFNLHCSLVKKNVNYTKFTDFYKNYSKVFIAQLKIEYSAIAAHEC